MSLETNSFATYAAKGNREDLSDVIYDISPTETPFLTAIPRVKASATKHEWQKDSLAAASGSNFVLEGDEATIDSTSASTRLDNNCGISDKTARVTGTQEAVNKAGRRSEMAYQMEKRMKELKRDVETILLANTAKNSGNATTARKVGGLQSWVLTNTNIASDATAATGDGSDAHTDGTARALEESFFEDVLAQCWDEGATPSLAILNKFQKRKTAAFNGAATPMIDRDSKKVVNTVDIYIDPLGSEVRLVPDRFAPADVVYFVDPEMAAFAVLRDFQTKDLARTGDNETKQILVEYTLEVRNEAAHGGIYDLTTS